MDDMQYHKHEQSIASHQHPLTAKSYEEYMLRLMMGFTPQSVNGLNNNRK